ncbi:MAG: Rpn family recombination-promoting nuclease/putative transposase [Bacteroidetes bacterium]|nr:MAG: Rpn family recombination-promoting nuclease/putative transposase [Bacteroidota bacterium]
MKFVDIKNDIAFRKIFGDENKKIILISFLNAVLKLESTKKIAEVSMQNPFQLPIIQSLKATIIDVKVKDSEGNEYIIEMQVANVNGLEKRLQYYLAKGYTSQIERGDDYDKLRPIVFIGIFDFNISKNPNYLSKHLTTDTDTGENLFKDFEFNLIELQKFNKTENQLQTIIDKWVYFIKYAESLEILPENIEDDGLKAAYQSAQMHTWTKQELEEYDYAAMREADGVNREIKAVKMSKLESAKIMLSDGFTIDVIQKVTGLTKQEIEQIIT